MRAVAVPPAEEQQPPATRQTPTRQTPTRQTPAAAAAASADLAAGSVETGTARGAEASTVASSSSSPTTPTVDSPHPASQTSAAAAETQAASATAEVAAGASDAAAAPRGRGAEEQRVVLLERPAAARGESPGACSEATDSTRCTDAADVVRPPSFGSWRYYSLADVSDEAMSAAGMQRACQLMVQQLRRAAAAAAGTPSPDAAITDRKSVV